MHAVAPTPTADAASAAPPHVTSSEACSAGVVNQAQSTSTAPGTQRQALLTSASSIGRQRANPGVRLTTRNAEKSPSPAANPVPVATSTTTRCRPTDAARYGTTRDAA